MSQVLAGARDWTALGAELAKRGTHRLALALHAARAAATGGGGLTPHEEDELVRWFGSVVDDGIRHTGGIRLDQHGGQHNDFAQTAWHVLVGDHHRDPVLVRPPRCPAVAAMELAPGEPGFVDALRIAASGYLRTCIAGACVDEIAKLCKLLVANDAGLEMWRPWNGPFGVDESNGPPSDLLEPAMAGLTMRHPTNATICEAICGYSSGFAQVASEHSIPPVARIGLITWLAKVALRDGEPPAPTLDGVGEAMRTAHEEREARKAGGAK